MMNRVEKLWHCSTCCVVGAHFADDPCCGEKKPVFIDAGGTVLQLRRLCYRLCHVLQARVLHDCGPVIDKKGGGDALCMRTVTTTLEDFCKDFDVWIDDEFLGNVWGLVVEALGTYL